MIAAPLVSIIIPCFNGERFIGDAIQSALGQTYGNKEVLVVDDGSRDGSLRIIRSFGGVVRWDTGPNRGGSAARNRGFGLARGELIQFLDADDLLHREKLERQVPEAVKHWPEIVFTRWQSQLMGEGGGHLFCRTVNYSDPVILALREAISSPAPLYPRYRLDQVGGWTEGLRSGQDFDLNLRLACAGASFVQLSESLVTVRRYPGSVSSDFARVLDDFEGICWNAYRILQSGDALTNERAEAFAAAFAGHARSYLCLGCVDRADARFGEALKMHPSGGLALAYKPWTRFLRRFIGPAATEKLVQVKRQLSGQIVQGSLQGD